MAGPRVRFFLLGLAVVGPIACGSGDSAFPLRSSAASGGAGHGGAAGGGATGGGRTGVIPCENSVDCLGAANGTLVCDRTTRICVECISNADCTGNTQCFAERCRASCKSDRDCTLVGQLCGTTVGHCVDCVLPADCPSGFACSAGACVRTVSTTGGSTGASGMGGLASDGTGGSLIIAASGGSAGTGGIGAGGIPGTGGMATGGAVATGGSIGTGGISSGGSAGAAGSSGAGGSGGSGGNCAGESIAAHRIPLDMYVLFDRSLSMNDTVTGGTKYDAVKGALTMFVQSAESNGIGIGIGYFPLVVANPPPSCTVDADCGNYGPCETTMVCTKADACLASNYTPDVTIALLPGVSTAIVDSLNAHTPSGFTPTYPALQASYQYVTNWANAHPNDETILVLATDGDPTTCDQTNNVNTIATNLVAPAFAGNPKIVTFVVGIGSSLTSLNQIAAAGGSQQALIVDTAGADPGGQFLAAMKAIRSSVLLGCRYEIPIPAGGNAFDPAKVNVQFTPLGGAPTLIKHVPAASACTPTDGGWYYDNPSAPTQIILCDSTCTGLNAGSGSTVTVVLGCATIG